MVLHLSLLFAGSALTLLTMTFFRRSADRLLQRCYALTLLLMSVISFTRQLGLPVAFIPLHNALATALVALVLWLYAKGAFRTNKALSGTLEWWRWSALSLVLTPLHWLPFGWLGSLVVHGIYAALLLRQLRALGFKVYRLDWALFLTLGVVPLHQWLIFALAPITGLFCWRIQYMLRQQIQALHKGQDKSHALEQKIAFDPLTKLFSRGYALESLERRLVQNKPTALIFLDLDNFKGWNDTYGHEFGDRVLTSVAKAIQNNIRTGDMAVRYAGDEMIVILETDKQAVAMSIAQKVLEAMREIDLGVERRITASIGVGIALKDDNLKDFLNRCDEGAYLAKRNGKNQVAAAPDPSTQTPIAA
jgi:diguanylate cyclase (GGDEF)-like protein